MELRYTIVTLSDQVGFESTYGYFLVYVLHLYLFGVVLAIFEKVR